MPSQCPWLDDKACRNAVGGAVIAGRGRDDRWMTKRVETPVRWWRYYIGASSQRLSLRQHDNRRRATKKPRSSGEKTTQSPRRLSK
ncbi:hypothetical protein M404DRAFT_992671 [Pisolithus tinctorius Marx 270]|uniref:Uncharacterized protein n=1 Tax=Pisolithus tinctorius Marx 270 TaxID=870435 RepID=A0A0C3PYS9_PISTI|nr:hypothetical protein M404DRAFT_992671 [Pisolithus tinctorius Marx 270]